MIAKFEYQGAEVSFENDNGIMINASQMAKPFCTKPSDWTRTEQAQRLIHALAASHKCELTDLVNVVNGGNNPGTWMHKDAAMMFAQWLSPEFYIWCNDRVQELLLTGQTSLALPNFNNPAEAARAWADQYEKALTAETKVKELEPKAEIYDSISNATNLLSMNDAAKVLNIGIGRNKLFEVLRSNSILRSNNTPYQSYIDQGYFEVKITTGSTFAVNYAQTYVTGKGLVWLKSKLNELKTA